jgi:hypothetical protein
MDLRTFMALGAITINWNTSRIAVAMNTQSWKVTPMNVNPDTLIGTGVVTCATFSAV